MTTIGNTFKTLADLGKELSPDMQSVAPIVELLSQNNQILDDIPWMAGNLTTGHRINQRTSLPTVQFKRLNQGVAPSKSTSAQLDEATAHIKAYSKVDSDWLKLSPNPASSRLNEDKAWMQSLGQFLAENLARGNAATNPDAFNGFLTRYATGVTGTPYRDSMINAGGTGSDNMSILLVGWGENTVSGLFPRNVTSGLQMKDRGEVIETDANGNVNTWTVSEMDWWCGLAVHDWRYVIRGCNIDHSELVANSSPISLVNLMIRMLERLPEGEYSESYRPVFYVPRAVRTMLRIQINDKANNNLTTETIAGRKVVAFDGVPVRILDRLSNAEAAVSFV